MTLMTFMTPHDKTGGASAACHRYAQDHGRPR